MKPHNTERGAALLTSLMVTMVLAAAAMSFVAMSFGSYTHTNLEAATLRAKVASEDGIQYALNELRKNVDVHGDGLGTITVVEADRTMEAVATDLGGNLWRVWSRGTVRGARQASAALVEVIPAIGISAPIGAAIAAKGDVTTLGNITIDGRDHDATGTVVTGPGVLGISSMHTIAQDGASEIGGVGIAPAHPTDPVTVLANDPWANGTDEDGDGVIDEEPWDGLDNDGDGSIDEDTTGYPTDPDAFLGLPAGTLMSIAQANGTYFTNQNQIDAYIANHGGSIPGGQIIYVNSNLWQPVTFGNTLNSPPSIIIHHNSTADAVMKNVHGQFCGLLISDAIEHLNGDVTIVGAIMSFADEAIGNAFGNGNAEILYSSEAIGNLPGGNAGRQVRIKTWFRASANEL